MKNTKKSGVLHFFIYRELPSKKYTGVCLELGLVDVSENPDYLKQSLIDAAKGYVHTIIKENLSDNLLNISPSKEYLDLYERVLNSLNVNPKPENTTKKTLSDVLAFTESLNSPSLAGAL